MRRLTSDERETMRRSRTHHIISVFVLLSKALMSRVYGTGYAERSNSTQLYMDGTFKSCPKLAEEQKLAIFQLYNSSAKLRYLKAMDSTLAT
ncbi:hypothetical protein L596_002505 [Steinernema carpocapsae]|uniref:Uncharacterized protein n=1 Tax=Steinernema carpocapsae TaxID=34508 RepID=A0A4V6I7F3_STECR|nr:hypothetical protein L596_002505 [Steinernema carpocapsae]